MSRTVLCPGCGGQVEVPEGHDRPRLRCPQCGVMCEVPAATGGGGPSARPAERAARPAERPGAAAAESAEEAAAARALLGDEEQRRPKASRPAPAARPAAAKPAAAKPRAAARPALKQESGAGGAAGGGAKSQAAVPPPAYPTEHSHEDDGKPYFVPSLEEERPCPNCRQTLPREAVLCNRCGFDLRTGQAVEQTYEPVEREWQPGWSYPTRLGVYAGVMGLSLVASVLGALAKGYWFGWFFPWLVLGAMLAFLLGTFERVRVTRNRKGRVRLRKTWRVCFLERPPVEVDVHAYGGVAYGPRDEVGFLEWLVLVFFLVCGLIPGIIWWYVAFMRDHYFVALTREHGFPDLTLYQGADLKLTREMAETIAEVAHIALNPS